MRRVLVVGEAPSRFGDPATPVGGRCAARLADIAGLSVEEFIDRTDRMNVLAVWPGAHGKGSAFPVTVAAERASILSGLFARYSIVVLLGRRVARAFRVGSDYFADASVRGTRVIVVPHPSGINRWFNDPENLSVARRHLARVFSTRARRLRRSTMSSLRVGPSGSTSMRSVRTRSRPAGYSRPHTRRDRRRL